MKNAAKFLALLIGFEVGLVMIFWLILIIVTSTDLYYSDAFLPWKPLLQILMYVGFVILSILGCYYIAYRFQLRPLEYLDDVTRMI